MTLQECIGDRMRLAGVVMQVDWQTVLQGSQMMQQPKEFARLSEENVATNMDRVRKEAASRGWLSNDLPSGGPKAYVHPLHAIGMTMDYKKSHVQVPGVTHLPTSIW